VSLSLSEILYGYAYLEIDIDETVFRDNDTRDFIVAMKQSPIESITGIGRWGEISPKAISREAFTREYNHMIYAQRVNDKAENLKLSLLTGDWAYLASEFPETAGKAFKVNNTQNPSNLILDEDGFFSFFEDWDEGFKGLRDDDFIVFYAPPKHGKLCADSTPVLTTRGWKTHGELNIGDYVYNRLGQPTKVLNVFNKGQYADYEVEFTDGEVIKVHGNHEWTVDVNRHGEKTLETHEMAKANIVQGERGKRGSRCKYQVDANKLIDFNTVDLPIHPYFLGLWLGDGYTSKPDIVHSPNDIESINKIISLGYKITHRQIHKDTGVLTTGFWGDTYQKFKSLDLAHKDGKPKHIPEMYKFSSKDQRLELLAGIIDSDGHVNQKTGRVVIANTNKALIEDIREVCTTLGFRITISEVAPKISSSNIQGRQTVYQLSFNPDIIIPTAIPRKHITKLIEKRKRGIIDIRKVNNSEKGKCIQVEGGIYLVGKNLVPTHNSTITAYLAYEAVRNGVPIGFYPTELSLSVTLKYILGFEYGVRGNEALVFFNNNPEELKKCIDKYNHLIYLPPSNMFNYTDYEALYESPAKFIFHDNLVRSVSQLGLNEDQTSFAQVSRRLATIQQKYKKCTFLVTQEAMREATPKELETNPTEYEKGKGHTYMSRALLQESSLALLVRTRPGSQVRELVVKNDRFRGSADVNTQIFAEITPRGKIKVTKVKDAMEEAISRAQAKLEQEVFRNGK
jgi:intein/homing endonuclease